MSPLLGMLYRFFGVYVSFLVRYACSGFLRFHSVIVAVGMNICRLIVRPADAKIKAGTEEKRTNYKIAKITDLKEKRGLGMGLSRCLSHSTLALNRGSGDLVAAENIVSYAI
jgi:hypothetical protein